MTRKWYGTLRHPKMQLHTKFGIPTSKNIRNMLWTQSFLKLGQVKVTRKWYATLRHHKMHLHTKLGIPTSKNIRYAPDTKTDKQCDYYIPLKVPLDA